MYDTPPTRAAAWRTPARALALTLALSWSCTEPTVDRATLERAGGAMDVASGDLTAKGAFTQCQNENPGPACNWVTGTLNAVHSKYSEGEVIPFKLLVKNATTTGNDAIHELTLSYGFQKATSKVNANYDFQATYDATLGIDANPCLDGSNLMNPFCTSGALTPGIARDSIDFLDPVAANSIGLDPNHLLKLQAAVSRFEQGESRKLYIVGGSFQGVTDPISATTYFGATDPSGSTIEARVTFRFRATSPDVMLLWGQHFASGIDWLHVATPPAINGASGQSGSPFHVVLEKLDETTIGGKALNVSGDVVEILPKAKVVLSPLTANNSIGESHTVTVTVSEAIDQSVTYSPAVGEIVTYTVVGSNGATPVVNAAATTCDDTPTDANGQCVIVFSSATAGLVTIHAQSNVSVGGKTVLASSGTGGDNSGDALKYFLAGSLTWAKVDGNGTLVAGAVFTVCRTANWNSDLSSGQGGYDAPLATPVCFDVTDNVTADNTSGPPTDRDGTGGEFQLGNLILGKYSITEKTAPPGGYTKDGSTKTADLSTTTTSATIATAFVNPKPNARISISPLDDDNNITEDHVLTATVEQDDGLAANATGGDATSGYAPASGITVTFTLANNTAGAALKPAGTSTCVTNASGQCSITITSSTAGGVDVSASATVTVSGQTFTRTTGTGAPNSASAHKDWLDGSVAWIKNDGAGQRLAGATFELCRTHTLNTATNPDTYDAVTPSPVCVSVTDKTPANAGSYVGHDTDGDAGEFKVEDLILGKYTVRETAAPTGYVILNANAVSAPDHTISLVDVTVASPFVNASPSARIRVTPLTDVNEVNDPHTITALVEADDGLANGGGDGVTGFGPVSGVTVTFTLPTNTASASFVGGDNDCVTAANGQCTVQINTTTAGLVHIHASATVTVQGVSVPVATGPGAGTSAGDDGVKRYVDAFITISPTTAVNAVGESHTFTAVMTAIPSGATPVTIADFTITVSPTPSTLGTTQCAAQVGNAKTCTIVINSTTAATFTANASATASIGGVSVTRDTDGATATSAGPGGSGSATKRYVDAFITISPLSETNNAGETHTFVAVATAIPGTATPVSIPDFTITVSNTNSVTPSTPGSTTCDPYDAATTSKTCRRTINHNASATFTANASATFTIGGESLTRDTDPTTTTIGSGPGGSGPATKIYVSPTLVLAKTPDKAGDTGYEVATLGIATFKIELKNTGDGPALNVALRDTLPNSGLTWTDDSGDCALTAIDLDPGVAVVNGQRLDCSLASLAAGATFTVNVSATIPAGYLVPTGTTGAQERLQVDGNLLDEGAGIDWENAGLVCPPPLANAVGCDIDKPTGSTDNSFGQGAKEDSPVPSVVDGSIPNNKSDLTRFYIAPRKIAVSGALRDFVYLAWERVQEPNGTTNMDFELNQNSTPLAIADGGNGVTPRRKAGDVLIKYDLSKGGGTLTMAYHVWMTAGTPSAVCEASNTVPCWGKGQALSLDPITGVAEGKSNADATDDPINPDATRTLSALTFGEARVDLQGAGIFQAGVCLSFGSAYLKSRSSDAFTSELKDFIAPLPIKVESCQDREIVNRAWARASNFAPSGGSLNDWFSDEGRIKVLAPTASRSADPGSTRLALAGGSSVAPAPATMSMNPPMVRDDDRAIGRDGSTEAAPRIATHVESPVTHRRSVRHRAPASRQAVWLADRRAMIGHRRLVG